MDGHDWRIMALDWPRAPTTPPRPAALDNRLDQHHTNPNPPNQMKPTITGPAQPTGAFPKYPERRRELCAEAVTLLERELAGNFQTIPAGGTDAKAFWDAIPEQHKRRGKNNVRQLSRAARRVYAWMFQCETLQER